MAELGPEPAKLNPIIAIVDCVAGLESTCCSKAFTTFSVRSLVASEGS